MKSVFGFLTLLATVTFAAAMPSAAEAQRVYGRSIIVIVDDSALDAVLHESPSGQRAIRMMSRLMGEEQLTIHDLIGLQTDTGFVLPTRSQTPTLLSQLRDISARYPHHTGFDTVLVLMLQAEARPVESRGEITVGGDPTEGHGL